MIKYIKCPICKQKIPYNQIAVIYPEVSHANNIAFRCPNCGYLFIDKIREDKKETVGVLK